MLGDADRYNAVNSMQMRDARDFLPVLRRLDWSRQDQDVVMDVGCGSGDTLLKVLLPAFPDVRRVVAIDVSPSMVEFARRNNAHEKVEYHVADFSDRSCLGRWEQQISKAISIYCFHWLKDQKTAFENVHYVLRPGGEAAAMFALTSPLYEACLNMMKSEKWRQFLQDSDPRIPPSYFYGHDVDYYRELVEKVGFEVMFMESKDLVYLFDDNTFADFCFCINALTKHIPADLKGEFRRDCYRANVDLSERSSDGRIEFRSRVLYTLLRKLL